MFKALSDVLTRNGRSRHNSFVVYEGPSRIDGAPIIVIATGFRDDSSNSKTGAMIQTHIMRADMHPTEALATGKDGSICGGCIHRPKVTNVIRPNGKMGYSGRSCYVDVRQGPGGVWKAWSRGNVPAISLEVLSELCRGRYVRLGSYGDPASVPLEVWRAYTMHAEGWTGYTHQARSPKLRDVLQFCQVSADSPEDARAAMRAGVGSFRVLSKGEAMLPGEIVCPASEEAGKVATCADCRACSGFSGANVAIIAHGIGANNYAGTRRRALSLPVINPARATA